MSQKGYSEPWTKNLDDAQEQYLRIKNSKFSFWKSCPVPVFSHRRIKETQDAMIPVSDLMMPFSINNQCNQ